jgi:flagellar basal body rod protein FlgG
MFLNPAMSAALERIADRASDVRRAFVPGAAPRNGDVATAAPASQFTLDPLSVSAPRDAFFITRDERGGYAYTRNGSFRIARGVLVDARGRALLGRTFANGPLAELRVDPVDAALNRASGARIEADGTLVYQRPALDPRTGTRELQRVAAGRLALARFPAATKLEGDPGGSYGAPPGVAPHIGVAGDATFAAISPMQRERSRVDLDASLARLKEAYVAFDALTAAQIAKDRFGKSAMDLVK